MKPLCAFCPVRLWASFLAVMAFLFLVPFASASEFWFRDTFNGDKDPAWDFYVPSAGPTESFDPAGFWTLYMPTTTTVFDHWSTVDNAPALYVDIPSANQGDDFFIETHLILDGPASGNFNG
ncbi:hypothetical protein HQ563_04795, partial [bacterium]|nr:hypothetical protein [bacterium]